MIAERDLYDANFIIKNYPNSLSDKLNNKYFKYKYV